MVNISQCFRVVCALALLAVGVLHAKDLTAYRVGDTADADIITTVPLDVIDPVATAARQTAEKLKVPAIFRSYPEAMTNTLVKEFSAAFAAEHAQFLAALDDAFQQSVLDEETIGSSDFSKFLTSFNQRKISFPVPAELAGLWAVADSGSAIEGKWRDLLLAMTHRPIRPDDLPAGLVLGDTMQLVSVASAQEPLTLADAGQRGKLITQASLTTITRLRNLFRRTLPDDQQPLARALQNYLKPNCVADAALTQQARAREVSQLVAVAHYDAGQVVVQRGEVIDAKTLAALGQLNDKLMPAQLNSQLAAARAAAQQALDQAQKQQAQAQQIQLAQDRELKIRAQELASQALAVRARNQWLWVALAGITSIALLAVWWLGRRTRQAPVKMEIIPAQNQAAFPANLAPQLTAILKEAVVQGLAAQRSELLQAQHAAAAEIAELVRRLDKIQAPIRERLRTYEVRIEELEKELALRSEENHELLKVKIEMLRSQLATEHATNPEETPGQFRYASSLRGKPFS